MPQYSTRFLLLLTAAVAVVFLIISLAFRGHTWAAGLTGAVFALALTISLHALLFGVVWTFGWMWHGLDSKSRAPSPFAAAQQRTDAVLDSGGLGSETQASQIE